MNDKILGVIDILVGIADIAVAIASALIGQWLGAIVLTICGTVAIDAGTYLLAEMD